MRRVGSRTVRLVVDASVARAAGNPNADGGGGAVVSAFLIHLRKTKMSIVFSRALTAEWDKHQSGFARKWRLSMVASRRLHGSDVAEHTVLRQRIENLDEDGRCRNAMRKDAHLVELAMHESERIVALDEEARGCFSGLVPMHPPLGGIVWVNPMKPADAAGEWLDQGAPKRRKLLLG